MSANNATLFLVATPIGNLDEVSKRTLEVLGSVHYLACEDTRNTIKLLTRFDLHPKMLAYHNFNEKQSCEGIIALLESGEDVALVSDAGYPLISDPGYELVEACVEHGFPIVPVSGPNAALNALVASGLDTRHYLFYGFLNTADNKAKKELEELRDFPYTLIFYEAPHRIKKRLKLFAEVLGDRKACLARELTKIHEEFRRGHLLEIDTAGLKGEMVLVIEGAGRETAPIEEKELLKEMDELLEQGYKVKAAAEMLAMKYHLKKNELYQLYLRREKNA